MLASQYSVNASQSRVGEAQSGYFPQVSLSGGYSRITPMPGSTSSSAPGFISTSGSGLAYDQYIGTAALTQLLYDFGKTPTQVSIAQLNLAASRSDLDATRAQTILAVKQAYFGLLKAQRNMDVAKETVGQYAQHLDQAKGFFEVGVKPKFDVTTAEVNLSNAQLSLITSDNALRIAWVTLNNAMGLYSTPEYRIEDSLAFVKKGLSLSQAIDTSMQNRPEILATERRVKAAEENVSLAKKGFFPVISGNAAYSRGSLNNATFRQDGWNAGVGISIPIFSGFLTYHQVKEADANYNVAKANYDLLKLNIVLEVQQAYLNMVAAADRIPTSELAQRQATENLEIANGRYSAGVGNPIEVTDAEVTYTNAKTTYTQALYDYNVAIANLDKSMGIK
jgi:outer membrane protein TolC